MDSLLHNDRLRDDAPRQCALDVQTQAYAPEYVRVTAQRKRETNKGAMALFAIALSMTALYVWAQGVCVNRGVVKKARSDSGIIERKLSEPSPSGALHSVNNSESNERVLTAVDAMLGCLTEKNYSAPPLEKLQDLAENMEEAISSIRAALQATGQSIRNPGVFTDSEALIPLVLMNEKYANTRINRDPSVWTMPRYTPRIQRTHIKSVAYGKNKLTTANLKTIENSAKEALSTIPTSELFDYRPLKNFRERISFAVITLYEIANTAESKDAVARAAGAFFRKLFSGDRRAETRNAALTATRTLFAGANAEINKSKHRWLGSIILTDIIQLCQVPTLSFLKEFRRELLKTSPRKCATKRTVAVDAPQSLESDPNRASASKSTESADAPTTSISNTLTKGRRKGATKRKLPSSIKSNDKALDDETSEHQKRIPSCSPSTSGSHKQHTQCAINTRAGEAKLRKRASRSAKTRRSAQTRTEIKSRSYSKPKETTASTVIEPEPLYQQDLQPSTSYGKQQASSCLTAADPVEQANTEQEQGSGSTNLPSVTPFKASTTAPDSTQNTNHANQHATDHTSNASTSSPLNSQNQTFRYYRPWIQDTEVQSDHPTPLPDQSSTETREPSLVVPSLHQDAPYSNQVFLPYDKVARYGTPTYRPSNQDARPNTSAVPPLDHGVIHGTPVFNPSNQGAGYIIPVFIPSKQDARPSTSAVPPSNEDKGYGTPVALPFNQNAGYGNSLLRLFNRDATPDTSAAPAYNQGAQYHTPLVFQSNQGASYGTSVAQTSNQDARHSTSVAPQSNQGARYSTSVAPQSSQGARYGPLFAPQTNRNDGYGTSRVNPTKKDANYGTSVFPPSNRDAQPSTSVVSPSNQDQRLSTSVVPALTQSAIYGTSMFRPYNQSAKYGNAVVPPSNQRATCCTQAGHPSNQGARSRTQVVHPSNQDARPDTTAIPPYNYSTLYNSYQTQGPGAVFGALSYRNFDDPSKLMNQKSFHRAKSYLPVLNTYMPTVSSSNIRALPRSIPQKPVVRRPNQSQSSPAYSVSVAYQPSKNTVGGSSEHESFPIDLSCQRSNRTSGSSGDSVINQQLQPAKRVPLQQHAPTSNISAGNPNSKGIRTGFASERSTPCSRCNASDVKPIETSSCMPTEPGAPSFDDKLSDFNTAAQISTHTPNRNHPFENPSSFSTTSVSNDGTLASAGSPVVNNPIPKHASPLVVPELEVPADSSTADVVSPTLAVRSQSNTSESINLKSADSQQISETNDQGHRPKITKPVTPQRLNIAHDNITLMDLLQDKRDVADQRRASLSGCKADSASSRASTKAMVIAHTSKQYSHLDVRDGVENIMVILGNLGNSQLTHKNQAKDPLSTNAINWGSTSGTTSNDGAAFQRVGEDPSELQNVETICSLFKK